MNCLQAENHFSAHLEDSIDYRTLRNFETHIEQCERCQREYVLFAQTLTEVEELPQVEPSPNFRATLHERLADEPRVTLPFWKRLVYGFTLPRWAYGALVLVFATSVTYVVYQQELVDSNRERAVPLVRLEQTGQLPAVRQTRGPALPSGFAGTGISSQPMQHYVLKQVSYTGVPTQGGL